MASGRRCLGDQGQSRDAVEVLPRGGISLQTLDRARARLPAHLGHSKVSMTLEVYAHVLPDQQEQAAATMGALLHHAR